MNYIYLLYGKPSLRQIPVLRLVLSRSRFCSTGRFHGNRPMRVFLFWSEACNQNSEKEEKAQNSEKEPSARAVPGNITPRSFSNGPRCTWSVLSRPGANIFQYGPRAKLVRGLYIPSKAYI